MLTVFVLILRGRRSWSLPTLLGASAAEPLVQLLRCGQLYLCQGSGSVSCSLSSGSCWSATVGTVPPPTQALLFARPAVWASRRVRAFLRRLSSVLPPFCNQKERCIPPPLQSSSVSELRTSQAESATRTSCMGGCRHAGGRERTARERARREDERSTGARRGPNETACFAISHRCGLQHAHFIVIFEV